MHVASVSLGRDSLRADIDVHENGVCRELFNSRLDYVTWLSIDRTVGQQERLVMQHFFVCLPRRVYAAPT